MEDGFYLLEYNDDDVVEFGKTSVRIGTLIKSIQEFYKSQNNIHGDQLITHLNNMSVYIDKQIFLNLNYQGLNYRKLFEEGVDCEILQLGSKIWNKGKMRIKLSVEFYLEESQDSETLENPAIIPPQSPLDDLRQIINQEIQA